MVLDVKDNIVHVIAKRHNRKKSAFLLRWLQEETLNMTYVEKTKDEIRGLFNSMEEYLKNQPTDSPQHLDLYSESEKDGGDDEYCMLPGFSLIKRQFGDECKQLSELTMDMPPTFLGAAEIDSAFRVISRKVSARSYMIEVSDFFKDGAKLDSSDSCVKEVVERIRSKVTVESITGYWKLPSRALMVFQEDGTLVELDGVAGDTQHIGITEEGKHLSRKMYFEGWELDLEKSTPDRLVWFSPFLKSGIHTWYRISADMYRLLVAKEKYRLSAEETRSKKQQKAHPDETAQITPADTGRSKKSRQREVMEIMQITSDNFDRRLTPFDPHLSPIRMGREPPSFRMPRKRA